MLFYFAIFMTLATYACARTDPFPGRKVHPDCYKDKDPGVVVNNRTVPRYYYSYLSGECTLFDYGGSGGNSNNFATKEACINKCLKSVCVTPPVVPKHHTCYLPKCVGTGIGYLRRYFFNTATGKCEEFCFSGCHGNANNFHSRAHCELTCLGCVSGSFYDEPSKGACPTLKKKPKCPALKNKRSSC